MDRRSSLLLCVALITLIGFGRSEAKTAVGKTDEDERAEALEKRVAATKTNEALELLFVVIDHDRDGIIKIDELESLDKNEQYCKLVEDTEQRKILKNLLKADCGIDIKTFKTLFRGHFIKQMITDLVEEQHRQIPMRETLDNLLSKIGKNAKKVASKVAPCCKSPAPLPAPPKNQQDQALEQLFLAMDADGDGIIKINDLNYLTGNVQDQFNQLIPNIGHRNKLLVLLKGACGINLDKFKSLFHGEFERQASLPSKVEDKGQIAKFVGVLTGLVCPLVKP